MVRLRRTVQVVFLLLFLFLLLQTEGKGADSLGYPAKLFLDFDPLLFLATVLSGHALAKAMLLSLALLGLTALLGRFFCGWVCPLGTLNNFVGSLRRWPATPRVRGWFRAKYVLLAFLLGGSLFGMQLSGLFDPLSLLVRSFSVGVLPGFNRAVNGTMDVVYRWDIRALTAPLDALYGLLKRTVLAFQQPYFHQALLVGAILGAILALNLLERRFWCRYLCPLGALLGIAGRWSPLKRHVAEGCTECGLCERDCQGAASTGKPGAWKASECFECLNCDDGCPSQKLRFGFSGRPAGEALDLGRRKLLVAGASGAAAVALSRASAPFKEGRSDPSILRPPGAAPEPEFLAKCVKCGECMKVCTTNGLQPLGFEAGLEGLWTPHLVPRMGYCEYRCTLCGQVCPTGAIRRLDLETKMRTRIGTAMVDRTRCLPWAHATPCIVCEEMCPVPGKALWYETVTGRNRAGQEVELKQPRVDLEKCIGCGICEAKCPVADLPAIRVTSIGETRNPKNQLLVDQAADPYGG